MATNTDLASGLTQEIIACAHRYSPFLEAIRDGGASKSRLADHLSVTNSTVYNRFDRLARCGLVMRSGGRYQLTNLGCLLADVMAEARAAVNQLHHASGFIDDIPQPDLPPPAVFRDSEVVAATERPGYPQVIFDRIVREADRLSGFIPSIHARHLDATRETPADDRAGEFVFQTATIEYLLSEHPDRLHEASQADGIALFETNHKLPFGLMLVEEPDELMCVSAYTDHGHESGLLISDSPAALEWAWTTYEEYRRDATRLTAEND